MDGCRKAPIMTIGINPNLTAFAPGKTGASCGAIRAFRARTTSTPGRSTLTTTTGTDRCTRSIFDLKFIESFLLPEGSIRAANAGPLLRDPVSATTRPMKSWCNTTVTRVRPRFTSQARSASPLRRFALVRRRKTNGAARTPQMSRSCTARPLTAAPENRVESLPAFAHPDFTERAEVPLPSARQFPILTDRRTMASAGQVARDQKPGLLSDRKPRAVGLRPSVTPLRI